MLSFQNTPKPPGKPLLPCNSNPGFCLTGWWATAQQPGWLHWRGHYASWASGGYQEVVEGWWGASLLWQSCRVPAQWLGILVRLLTVGRVGWGVSNILGEISASWNFLALKNGDPRTEFSLYTCLVRLWTVFYYALNSMPLRPLPQFPSLCIT